MGSRARIGAAACLVASGLLAGGTATAPAFAEPGASTKEDVAGAATAESSRQPGHRHDGHEERSDPPARSSGRPATDAAAAVDVGDSSGPEDDPIDPSGSEDDPIDPGADPDSEPADLAVDGGADGDPVDPEAEEKPRPPCCEQGDEDCGPGGWPWPWPPPRVAPEEVGSGGDYRFGGGLPSRLPAGPIRSVPSADELPEVLPPLGDPVRPDAIDTVPGIGVGAGGVAGAPMSAPLVVAGPIGPAAGAGLPAAGAGSPGLPAAPRQASATPPQARQSAPATAGANVRVPAASYRVGYGEYLRTAGMSQVAALALPGLAGILVLTGAGGLLGYRQAKAGHAVRTIGIARFMN
ncbi:hypothetical protein JDV09_02505 [Mycobacterium sp. Y57]|uniref:hypothetical protein n=1 Tax=Mycolicibacterium xanthum TaxID=2796469 RepID=UPI001C844360|nr:hypothetical protein [Mycolicibacterium xanthum]MBX7430988.1 hypothetical protein [Mycolicibacterium xanthum]